MLGASCSRYFLAVTLFCGMAGIATAETAAPALILLPRQVHLDGRQPMQSAIVVVPGGDAEDIFTAEDLGKALKARGVTVAPRAAAPRVTVTLLRVDSKQAQALLEESKLSFTPATRTPQANIYDPTNPNVDMLCATPDG